MYNYDKVAWDMGTASTTRARAGWATASGESFELPGSGTAGALLDSGAGTTSLVQNSLNSAGQLGRYVWQVRSGAPPNAVPVITVPDRVLEGNASTGYLGYTGAADATATDVDGTVWTLSSDLPATLPLGTTSVLWTATDNMGAVATETQTITVNDTAPPSNPSLASPTHPAGVWSANPSVVVNGLNSTDACTGLTGFSYSWTSNAAGTPDTVVDSVATTTVSSTATSMRCRSMSTSSQATRGRQVGRARMPRTRG
jgi:hypothetical protein